MKKHLTIIFSLLVAGIMFSACSNGDPHNKGVAAGKASCDCYQLENLDDIESCLDKIEKENAEYLTDTAYTNAVELQMIECISQGVVDIVK